MKHYAFKYAKDLQEFKDPLVLSTSHGLIAHLTESETPEPDQPPGYLGNFALCSKQVYACVYACVLTASLFVVLCMQS
jgi:hypothetical protein